MKKRTAAAGGRRSTVVKKSSAGEVGRLATDLLSVVIAIIFAKVIKYSPGFIADPIIRWFAKGL